MATAAVMMVDGIRYVALVAVLSTNAWDTVRSRHTLYMEKRFLGEH